MDKSAIKIKRMKDAWKNRKDYIKDIKDEHFYNIWRSVKFTKKGKQIGCTNKWDTYRSFYEDMFLTYQPNKRLIRMDKTKKFSKNNCIWATDEESGNLIGNNIIITYNNEEKTIKEWAYSLNKLISSIRNRYHKYKNTITIKEILFGKKRKNKKEIISAHDLTKQKAINKASKMCSAYRFKDNKKGYYNDLTKEWLIDNILFKHCIYCGTDNQIGCDRIDNTKGHTINNVVPCCYSCNVARGDRFSHEETFIIGDAIKKILKHRGQEYI